MIYRFKPSEKKHEPRVKKPYRRAGADSPRRLFGYRYDTIDLSTLFELAKLEGATEQPRRKEVLKKIKQVFFALGVRFAKFTKNIATHGERLFDKIRATAKKTYAAFKGFIVRTAEKRRKRKKGPSVIPILTGALCAVTLVAFLSAFAVLYKLLFSEFFGRYEKITVPSMVGMDYEAARASLDEDNYNVTVTYEYSATVPKGEVIFQMPSGGAERKIFADGELCDLQIRVSLGKQLSVMDDYASMRSRDVKLFLKNGGFSVVERAEHSDTVAKGCVIYTSPSAGEKLEAGGLAILYVSLGPRVSTVKVPNVCGLTENKAAERIVASGFTIGNITYKSSPEKAGTVLSQSPSYDQRAKKGSSVSIEVSAGQEFNYKSVPSLYGLTLAQAKERLAEYGLVAGNIYAAESNEPKGTIISQSPAADTPITPSLVGVDMYVSS